MRTILFIKNLFIKVISRFDLKLRLSLTILCLILFSTFSQAGLKIYYIRHGEAGHNVVKEWKNVPKEQWPVYVGNSNMFTPKGEAQVLLVAEKLKKYSFDFIAVSPAWRTKQTILPYLKLMGLKAIIWPELNEFGSQPTLLLSPDLPAPSKKYLNSDALIQIPAEESAYFQIREDGKYKYELNQSQEPEAYSADIKFMLQKIIDRVHKQFGGTEKSILLVGHGNNGKSLLKLFLNDNLDKIPSIKNTGVWMIEEQKDGTFKLKLYNDEPFN